MSIRTNLTIILIFILTTLTGCGSYYYTTQTPMEFSINKGRIEVSSGLLVDYGGLFNDDSFIDYNSLNFTDYDYYDFNIKYIIDKEIPYFYELKIDSIAVYLNNFRDTVFVDWKDNITHSYTYGLNKYFRTRIAPIPIPKGIQRDYTITFIVQIFEPATGELIESSRISSITSKVKKHYTINTLPCYTPDYTMYKDVATHSGNYRFHLSKLYFDENKLEYFQEIIEDSSFIFMNFGLSFQSLSLDTSDVEIIVDSISLILHNDNTIPLRWLGLETIKSYGRFYTPVSALKLPIYLNPKSRVKLYMNTTIQNKLTKQVLTKDSFSIQLKPHARYYEFDKVKQVH